MLKKVKVIAEIGCNHKGDMDLAKQLIDEAVKAGADVAKFQKRNNIELLSEKQYNAPHPNPENSYGATYGEHREFLEFNQEQHRELQEYCEEKGIIYSTSVWDLTSAREIAELKPKLIKIPSAMSNNFKMIEFLCENYEGELHISTGMSTFDEIDQLIQLLTSKNRIDSVVLYSCTSGYPVPAKDVRLLDITRLKEEYGNHVKEIGFSGHHLGINLDVAAYALGATWIERHFTLDKNWKGTDHAASLEPDELQQLIVNLHEVGEALHDKSEEILEIEKPQREKLKYNG